MPFPRIHPTVAAFLSILLIVGGTSAGPSVTASTGQTPTSRDQSPEPSRDTVVSPARLFDRVSRSVVIVESIGPDGLVTVQGSGVVISRSDLEKAPPSRAGLVTKADVTAIADELPLITVVTNRHVVADTTEIRVSWKGNAASVASISYVDIVHDLALISVAGLDMKSAPLRRSDTLRVGERVYSVGAPRGLELTLAEGLISSLRAQDRAFLVQTTAPISPGSSGGGLFDGLGRLVGITTFAAGESQNLNFALPVEWIQRIRVQSPRRDRDRWTAAHSSPDGIQPSAPTLAETLAWLKTMLDRDTGGVANVTNRFTYEDCHVRFTKTLGSLRLTDTHLNLRDVASVRLEEAPVGTLWSGTFLVFRTLRGEPGITHIRRPTFDSMLVSEKVGQFKWHLGSVHAGTSNDYLLRDAERVIRAFHHTVELCGGRIQADPF